MTVVHPTIIDISPPVCETTAVWPGDVPFTRSVQADIHGGANIHLSSLNTTVHCGAHADAPLHYHPDGKPIDEIDLNHYIGPCQVITIAPNTAALVRPEDIARKLKAGITRILFKTGSQPAWDHFNTDYMAVAPEAVELCAASGVVLLGIDTASFDPFTSKELPAHKLLYKHNIRNLECLQLAHVDDGIYELIALPLKLKGFDASPVRAVLRRI